MLKGLFTTLKMLFTKPVTIQYAEQKRQVLKSDVVNSVVAANFRQHL